MVSSRELSKTHLYYLYVCFLNDYSLHYMSLSMEGKNVLCLQKGSFCWLVMLIILPNSASCQLLSVKSQYSLTGYVNVNIVNCLLQWVYTIHPTLKHFFFLGKGTSWMFEVAKWFSVRCHFFYVSFPEWVEKFLFFYVLMQKYFWILVMKVTGNILVESWNKVICLVFMEEIIFLEARDFFSNYKLKIRI